MIFNIFIATVIYFIIGYTVSHLWEPANSGVNVNRFAITFLVALAACLLYYYTWITLGLTVHRGVEGLFSRDSSTYYMASAIIARSEFEPAVMARVITDHYHELFLAAQLYVFGEHVLIPKIYQVMLFSIGVMLWVSVAEEILRDKKMVKHFFYLMVFCVPLLTYNAHVLKEISLFFSTSVAVYGFVKYNYRPDKQVKHIAMAVVGIIMMFLFRREFALVMFFSFVFATLWGANISLNKRLAFGFMSLIVFLLVSNLPFFQNIGATAPLTEGGIIRTGRTETLPGGGGFFGNFTTILSNPLTVGPYFIYGVLQLFFHPPFLYSPAEMIERGDLSYLTMGYYNLFFSVTLPAFYFGGRYLFKNNIRNTVFVALLLYFIFASLGTIFGSDSYRRFKISYFWPIAFICVSYGIATFPQWRRHLPLCLFVFIVLIFVYAVGDIIGFVS